MSIHKKNIKRNFLILSAAFFMLSCSSNEWSSNEQTALKKRCLTEGGSKSYCNCYLKNAMKVYDNLGQMENITFEEAVELSLNCE